MKRLVSLFVVAVMIATTAPQVSAQALEDPIPERISNGTAAVGLELVADGLVSPLTGRTAPGHENHLYVVDQVGHLWAIDVTNGDKTMIADVSGLLVPLGAFGPGTFDERGFLGVAFDPDYQDNGYIYTFTSEPVAGVADFSTMPSGEVANHQSVVSRWQSTDPGDPDALVDADSREILLTIDQPQFNHNSGELAIGPDGYLYIAVGDGGGADDQGVGHGENGNGQDLTNPLGSILRIDPHGSNSANGSYGIPSSNPFVGTDYVEETFAYGFRNAYRMNFDRKTGKLWAGDVGQNHIEEVDIVRAGGNYGWNLKEGSFVFDPNGDDDGFVTAPVDLGTIDPVAEYDHDEGISVIGGFVYRGDEVDALKGRYVFGDFLQRSQGSGRLFTLSRGRSRTEEILLPNRSNDLGFLLFGFGEDHDGELYTLGSSNVAPVGTTGTVHRIVEADAERRFEADLSGDNEVPPVASDASGEVKFKANRAWTRLEYEIELEDIEGVVQAHIHLGPPDANGGVVTFLFRSATPVDVEDGRLVRGVLTADDLVGDLADMPLADLIGAMQSGNAYVNVHTTAVPSGEVRGQIEID